MTTLMAQDRKPYVFVGSIPNIHQLWQVLHTNSLARWAWANFHICQSMLGATRTEAERQQVVAREQAFNQILADVCGQYSRCRWDGGAVYHYQFTASQVSALDFFHPSLSGQAALARVTWAASWWPRQLTQQPSAPAWTLALDRPERWAAAVGRAASVVNPGAWVVTRSGRRVRPRSAAGNEFTPSLEDLRSRTTSGKAG